MTSAGANRQFEYVLVGGGLQNALLAQALAALQPRASVALVESERTLGGAHTWCFHTRDLDPTALDFASPLVTHAWDGYDVRFPQAARTLGGGYRCVTGGRLHEATSALFSTHTQHRLLLGRRAKHIAAHEVELDDGERLTAEVVIDARGPSRLQGDAAGYQKFVGLELELSAEHGLTRPLLMDALVEQIDGFRFMYVLPFERSRVLVEDTRFSDSPALDAADLRAEILRYAAAQGLRVRQILREEIGVLPLPARLPPLPSHGPLKAGYAGGWLHPTTGYSFPIAARLSHFIARRPAGQLFGDAFQRFSREHARQARFASLLNRLLFDAVVPEQRRGVFERFYRLEDSTIARFYALTTTPLDRARILCGRPPPGLSLRRALARGMSS